MKYKLSQLFEIIGGGTPKTTNPDYWGGPIPWLSVKDFNNDNRYVYSTEKTITEKGLLNSATSLLQKDDIIISARGTVGEMASIPFPMAFNQSCYGLRARREIVDVDYLYYLVKFKVKELKHNSHGSVFDTITRDTFDGIVSEIPDLSSQRKIGQLLANFDEKIELNNAINDNLQQQAIALYRNSFPYAISDSLPDGWHIATIGDIIELHDSRRIPLSGGERDRMEKKIYPYYGATSLMDYVDNYIFDGIYLLLGEDGTVIDAKGYPVLQYVWGKFWVNNHAHIITGKGGFSVESLWVLFKNTSVRSIVTGAVQPKISQANLRSIRIVVPPIEMLKSYDDKIQPMFSAIRNNINENERLTAIRDSLLPNLMNGELDVSEVEL